MTGLRFCIRMSQVRHPTVPFFQRPPQHWPAVRTPQLHPRVAGATSNCSHLAETFPSRAAPDGIYRITTGCRTCDIRMHNACTGLQGSSAGNRSGRLRPRGPPSRAPGTGSARATGTPPAPDQVSSLLPFRAVPPGRMRLRHAPHDAAKERCEGITGAGPPDARLASGWRQGGTNPGIGLRFHPVPPPSASSATRPPVANPFRPGNHDGMRPKGGRILALPPVKRDAATEELGSRGRLQREVPNLRGRFRPPCHIRPHTRPGSRFLRLPVAKPPVGGGVRLRPQGAPPNVRPCLPPAIRFPRPGSPPHAV